MSPTLPSTPLANWGNYPVLPARIHRCDSVAEAARILARCDGVCPRGLGRCYGDAALFRDVLSMRHMRRLLSFDPESRLLVCEAGCSFDEILAVFVPRGFFLPVTPGTRFVTVGGAIAADVHGKNHHVAGSFGNHVAFIKLLLPDGSTVTCSRDHEASLFHLTLGGMGLTGLILEAGFFLIPIESAYILQKSQRYPHLDAIMEAFETAADCSYSVAWIDGLARGRRLGRSVLFTGEHAAVASLPPRLRRHPLSLPEKRKLAIPFPFPSWTLNAFTVKAFNALYYGKAPSRPRYSFVDYDTFFYPLDNILHWNRLYGKQGFTQYQFVLPLDSSRVGLRTILSRIADSGLGSFLSVLKLFGKQEGILSFPREGYTLAMDFPIHSATFSLLDTLDRLVLEFGGRIYLAKDARMSAETFRAGYAHHERFQAEKRILDSSLKLSSAMAERLEITAK